MGRKPCCSKLGLLRGSWSPREDTLLINYIQAHGEGHWRSLPKKAGLLRCGKSCRLRWMNYLRPDIKRGNITPDEDDLIIRLHSLLGNRWSLIAKRLPGRTDNEIKNYWNTHLGKRVQISQPNSKHAATNIKRKAKSKPKPSEKKQDNKLDLNDHNPRTNPATEPKLHLPKGSRVSPFSVISRSSSFDSIISGSLSSTGEGSKSGAYINNDSEGFDIPSYSWSDTNAGNATLISDKDQEFDYGFEADTFLDAATAPVPAGVGDDDGMMFDDIFEEYEQLLKAEHDPDPDPDESFLNSILI